MPLPVFLRLIVVQLEVHPLVAQNLPDGAGAQRPR